MTHGSTSTPPAAPARYSNPAEALISAKAARLIRLAGLPVKLAYGPKDVAGILDIGWRTVYTMMQDGRLPSVGRPARIPVEALAPILDPQACDDRRTIAGR
jgi:hypothetical protein